MKKITQQEALDIIASGEDDAYGLLTDRMPTIERRWGRLCLSMVNLLKDVRVHFPDAEYYTASGGFNLLIGRSHGDAPGAPPQSQLEALGGTNGVRVGDGDF